MSSGDRKIQGRYNGKRKLRGSQFTANSKKLYLHQAEN